LSGKYAGAKQYESRIREILDSMPEHLSELHVKLSARLHQDLQTMQLVGCSKQSVERYARKLLHRLSESLAFGLLCELTSKVEGAASSHCVLTALRYFEEIEPPAIGAENDEVRYHSLELLEETQITQARNSPAETSIEL